MLIGQKVEAQQMSNLDVCRDDFVDALGQFAPSVSEEELQYYESIKKTVFSKGAETTEGKLTVDAKTSKDDTNAKDGSEESTRSSGRDNMCSGGLLSTALLPPLHLYQDVRKENE